MATMTESFVADGVTRVYTPANKILSESHARVDFAYEDPDGILRDHLVTSDKWDIINNSVVFKEPPTEGYVVKITISTDGSGLSQPPSDTTKVADNIDDVVKVADSIEAVKTNADHILSIDTLYELRDTLTDLHGIIPDIQTTAREIDAVIEAYTNAINAKTSELEARAARLTAESLSSEDVGVFCKEYYVENGAILSRDMTVYSAYHWKVRASEVLAESLIDDSSVDGRNDKAYSSLKTLELLLLKADKSNTYTKDEVDTKILRLDTYQQFDEEYIVEDDTEVEVLVELCAGSYSPDLEVDENTYECQAGELKDFAMVNPKGRWIFCDGRELSREEYKDLFEAIGVTYGAGDGATTFNIPDFRGMFKRTIDAGKGLDYMTNRRIGSYQPDMVKSHRHYVAHWRLIFDAGTNRYGQYISGYDSEIRTTDQYEGYNNRLRLSQQFAPENTVKNIAVYTCIRY